MRGRMEYSHSLKLNDHTFHFHSKNRIDVFLNTIFKYSNNKIGLYLCIKNNTSEFATSDVVTEKENANYLNGMLALIENYGGIYDITNNKKEI